MLTYHPDNALSAFLHRTGIITDDSRICRFAARVSITTASHSLEEAEVLVSATVDGSRDFGRLGFLEAKVNPLLFPTDFDAKWQRFSYVDEGYLQITGTHPKKMIGRYVVRIAPLPTLPFGEGWEGCYPDASGPEGDLNTSNSRRPIMILRDFNTINSLLKGKIASGNFAVYFFGGISLANVRFFSNVRVSGLPGRPE